MKRLVVLSGSGVSAESGLQTFRDNNGLWGEYRVEDVASTEGWRRNPELMINFYNGMRRKLKDTLPNEAHKIIASLEKDFDVTVITQNIDDLHERAGSSRVIHLHGELTKARSVFNEERTYDIGYGDIKMGEKAPDGGQLRPFVVWFGESVPKLSEAAAEVENADIFLIIGTSLVVYPAAGLVTLTRGNCKIFLVDPADINISLPNLTHIKDKATSGMKKFTEAVENLK